MKKKTVIMIGAVLAVSLAVTAYWLYGQAEAELANNITREIRQEDFILHIRAERIDEGFQVFRSIQYFGDDTVEITHQTPLVSVSFKQQNHDYTGSTVAHTLKTGSSYYPQNAKTFALPKKGVYTLFCEARFSVKGEQKTITHEEELVFQ
ncbi:hypothetical protein [Lentibacillus salinarum]|uniref:EfeO-type cupredoxin-like domain-containing protein n=1 Tax=Lentibacillus salinarum TaxID=446820 RepID=A0ABW3ZT10_9BACI